MPASARYFDLVREMKNACEKPDSCTHRLQSIYVSQNLRDASHDERRRAFLRSQAAGPLNGSL
jgi:hypothetical protein